MLPPFVIFRNEGHITGRLLRRPQHHNGADPWPTFSPARTQCIDVFLASNPFAPEIVAKRAPDALLYRQPTVLPMYYLIDDSSRDVKKFLPLTQYYIRTIFVDIM